MFRSEERSSAVFTSRTLAIDGVVRVRRLGFGRRGWRVVLESRDPVAVIVRRDSGTERLRIKNPALPSPLLMLIAMPVAARVATKFLARR